MSQAGISWRCYQPALFKIWLCVRSVWHAWGFFFFCLYSETSNANIDMVAREIFFPFWKPFNIFSDRLGKVVFNLFNLRLYSPHIMTHFLFHFMSIYGKKCKNATHKHIPIAHIYFFMCKTNVQLNTYEMHTHTTDRSMHTTQKNMNIHKTHMCINILSHKHMHTLIYSCKYNTHVHIITWDKIYIWIWRASP